MTDHLWTEPGNHLGRVFDEAERAARPQRWVRTHRDQPCHLHTEPGPEMWDDEDGTEHPVTDELREQWDREVGDVLVIRRTIVGTCKTAGCTPAPEPEPMRTDSHSEEPPEPKTETKPAAPMFWVL